MAFGVTKQVTQNLKLPPGDFARGVKGLIGRAFAGGIEVGLSPTPSTPSSAVQRPASSSVGTTTSRGAPRRWDSALATRARLQRPAPRIKRRSARPERSLSSPVSAVSCNWVTRERSGMEQASAIHDLRNKVPAAAFHRSMPRYRCPSCCCGPALVLRPPKGVVPVCSSCASPLQRQPLVRPIPLLVLLTVGAACSWPPRFPSFSLPEPAPRSRPEKLAHSRGVRFNAVRDWCLT